MCRRTSISCRAHWRIRVNEEFLGDFRVTAERIGAIAPPTFQAMHARGESLAHLVRVELAEDEIQQFGDHRPTVLIQIWRGEVPRNQAGPFQTVVSHPLDDDVEQRLGQEVRCLNGRTPSSIHKPLLRLVHLSNLMPHDFDLPVVVLMRTLPRELQYFRVHGNRFGSLVAYSTGKARFDRLPDVLACLPAAVQAA